MRRRHAHVDRLQRLVVFEAAARCGSFSAAARELGMTQPAVTRHVRALERTLGVELFSRSANRARLTPTGSVLAERLGAGLDLVESGLADLDATATTFVLASHPGIAQQWLVPHIDDVHELLGELELRLWLFDRDEELRDGGFDAALRIGDGRFEGQSAHRLFGEVVVPVASQQFAEDHGLDHTSSAAEVNLAPFVHMDDGASPWMTWAEWLDSFGIVLERQPGRVMWNNYPMVLQQALAGRGVALGWRPLVDDLVAGDALVVVGPEVRSTRGYYVTWQAGEPTDAVRSLVTWLESAIP